MKIMKVLVKNTRNITSYGRQFVDKTSIQVVAGNGGKGCSSSSSYGKLKKRPDGGDGGNGVGKQGMNSLKLEKTRFVAKDGESGRSNNKTGLSASDLVIGVPFGTEIYKNGVLFGDIVDENTSVVVVSGGKGGKGSQRLIKMTNRTNFAAFKENLKKNESFFEGESGEEATLDLRLKLIGDVGLVGFPNAGKSSLLAAISRRKPKIASYAFTTLMPSIGRFQAKGISVAVADIPGITETEHRENGLIGVISNKSHEFLQHIERNNAFIYVIGIPSLLELGNVSDGNLHEVIMERLETEFKTLLKELEKYQCGLSKRPAMLVLNKLDNLMEILEIEEQEAVVFAKEVGLKLVISEKMTTVIKSIVPISLTESIEVDSLKEALIELHASV